MCITGFSNSQVSVLGSYLCVTIRRGLSVCCGVIIVRTKSTHSRQYWYPRKWGSSSIYVFLARIEWAQCKETFVSVTFPSETFHFLSEWKLLKKFSPLLAYLNCCELDLYAVLSENESWFMFRVIFKNFVNCFFNDSWKNFSRKLSLNNLTINLIWINLC